MRIGIDAGPLLGQGGISGYVAPLVRTLVSTDTTSEYRLVLRRGWSGPGIACDLEKLAPVVQVRIPDRILCFWWDRVARVFPVHRDLWRSLDVFLATCLVAPVLPGGRVVSIVYDLIPLRLPGLFPERDRFRRRLEHLVRGSAAVVAISHRTRTDLIELLGVDPLRIRVVYPGTGKAFHPADPDVIADVAARYGIRGQYILYVGALGPHKNVTTLLRAYERARLRNGLTAQLVLVGSQRWGEQILSLLETLHVRSHVVLTGPVPAADLPPLYSGAACFVFPSCYEGFGLPVLEAMACGTPVVASNAGALPEVTGRAGLLVDPEDPEGLAAGMCQLVTDQRLRADLSGRGLSRAAEFSWERSASDLLTLLREVGEGNHRHA
jgi:glycosyltransferase involved in cell wall biosynthesis